MEDRGIIEIDISNNAFGGKRKARVVGFENIDFEGKTASIIIRVFNFDEKGERINNPDIREWRNVSIPLSNSDRVIDGILIEQDDPRYEDATPEFDWWMQTASQVPLIPMLEQALQMLAQTGRFDRL